MLSLWEVENKHQFPSVAERQPVSIPLPITEDGQTLGCTVTQVAGAIPSGLVIFGTSVAGTPNEVSIDTISTAVFRAAVEVDITFYTRVTYANEVVSVVEIDVGDPSLIDITPFKVVSSSVLTEGSTYYIRNLIGNQFTLHRTLYDAESRKSPIMFDVSDMDGKLRYYEDRTLNFVVTGPDKPQWVTSEGLLSVNPSGHVFVMYNTPVDFQLVAVDDDVSAGQSLEFFIESFSGELPPGLELSKSGRIHGIIGDAPAIDIAAGNGDYDSNWYDSYPYDFGTTPIEELGIEDSGNSVRKLSRTYEFIVSCSDGVDIVKRQFRIYVIPEEFLRADNALIQVGHSAYTADVTYLRAPYWMTEANLGQCRSSDRVTIFLEAYNPSPNLGIVEYFNDPLNTTAEGVVVEQNGDTIEVLLRYGEISPSNRFYYEDSSGRQLQTHLIANVEQNGVRATITGVNLPNIPYDSNIIFGNEYAFIESFKIDSTNGTIYGEIGDITNTELKFTVGVTKIDSQYSITREFSLFVSDITGNTLKVAINGESVDFTERLVKYIVGRVLIIGPNSRPYWVTSAQVVGNLLYLELDRSPSSDTFVGDVIPLTASVPANWIYATATNRKTFTLSISEEVVGDFKWVTDTLVGTLIPDKTSTLKVEATGPSNIKYYVATTYDKNTTTFSDNGVIIRQDFNIRDGLYVDQDSGLIIGTLSKTNNNIFMFDGGVTTFDRELTTIDSVISFTVFAVADILGTTRTISKRFAINVGKTSNQKYSNMWLKSYMDRDQREYFDTLVSNATVFPASLLYRPTDPSFGVQREVKMLLAAGISTATYEEYIASLEKNFTRKKLWFGRVKVARSLERNTHMYDVVYVEMIDPLENENKDSIPLEVSVNSGILYPNSIENMRTRLFENLGRNDSLNPQWMLTPQTDGTISGYVKAIPLCYCLPNSGTTIARNIENIGFDFTKLTFDVDRVIVDSIIEDGIVRNEETFLLFPEVTKQIGDLNE